MKLMIWYIVGLLLVLTLVAAHGEEFTVLDDKPCVYEKEAHTCFLVEHEGMYLMFIGKEVDDTVDMRAIFALHGKTLIILWKKGVSI